MLLDLGSFRLQAEVVSPSLLENKIFCLSFWAANRCLVLGSCYWWFRREDQWWSFRLFPDQNRNPSSSFRGKRTQLECCMSLEAGSWVHYVKLRVLFREVALATVAEWCGSIAKLGFYVVENLGSVCRRSYLFYLSGTERGALGKE